MLTLRRMIAGIAFSAAATVVAAGVTAGAVSLAAAPALAAQKDVTLPAGYPERVLGKADAPVTIYEYSSLTCPHCAAFHKETLPKIKEAYIDTGKVKLVMRDFPLDQVALGGALMARCAPEPMYFRLLEVLFANQQTWARANNPLDGMKQYGRLSGMSDDTLNACFKNETLFKQIQDVQAAAQQTFQIQSTPSFVIDGQLYAGSRDFAAFSKIIDGLLPK